MPLPVETVQLAARVPVPLVERLEQIAAADPELTLSSIIRAALRAYVKQNHPMYGYVGWEEDQATTKEET